MDVGKIIRAFGYIVYTALWLPVIVLFITIVPLVLIGMDIRSGSEVRRTIAMFKNSLVSIFQHDIEFIKTGKW